jgi:hypothetical protein
VNASDRALLKKIEPGDYARALAFREMVGNRYPMPELGEVLQALVDEREEAKNGN